MSTHPTICVLCGCTQHEKTIIQGAGGCTCLACLGEALRQLAICAGNNRWSPAGPLTGNSRCLLCSSPVSEWQAVAYRGTYCYCGSCLETVLSACLASQPGDDGLRVVAF